MKFQDLGENDFIKYLSALFPTKSPIVGIGDDCAVIPGEHGMSWLITTDALVEGVHFLKDEIRPLDLGYKTVAVNVSDITAMGGEPKYAFLSIALPKTVDCAWVYDVVQGIKDACKKWDLLLLGGDTVGSKRDVFLNLTLIGSASTAKIKYRRQARSGDIICVGGYLGNAGAGLKAIQAKTPKTKDIKSLLHAHFHPEPYPEQGIWLASQSDVHAMMDISDGLACDLKRLLQSSQKGATIEISSLPLSPMLTRVCQKNGWDALECALTGGEDYCLLLTISAEAFESIRHSFQEKFGFPLYAIGAITDEPAEIIYRHHGKTVQMHYTNFDHFR